MNLLKTIKKNIKNRLGIPCYNQEPITLSTSSPKIRGTVLYSYLDYPLVWPANDYRFDGHSNLWESREIVRIFQDLGFNVDAVAWNNSLFYPEKKYDVVFDIHTNLQRWTPFLSKETKKILHLTGSYFIFQRDAELSRVASFENRTGNFYSPKRIPADLDLAKRSHDFANNCSLIGNNYTLSTYPQEYREKITLLPVSGSRLNYVRKNALEYTPAEREFLCFYGGGAVHKGLDLVLEVFKRNSQLKLHVVAKLESERDFLLAYGNVLLHSSNIIYHGYLHPCSKKFQDVTNRVIANIAPSCSEGTSSATVTCMQYGFYPIISRQNGITLPDNAGTYLETCSIDEIEQRIFEIYQAPSSLLVEQIELCQAFALKEFSRENFSAKMRSFLTRLLH